MYLLEIFLPLFDQQHRRFAHGMYERVERELVERFQGFTAYSRPSASGLWKEDRSELQSDELVIYEVMTDNDDWSWWKRYRRSLEERFDQDQILIRSQTVTVIE